MNARRTSILLLVSVIIIITLIITTYHGKPVISSPKQQVSSIAVQPLIPNPYRDTLFAEYEQTMNALLHQTGIPGAAIAVIKDSSILFMKGFGVKTLNTTDSVDENTVFRIGSVSKCFAAVLTSMLVHDGTLHWNDPVVQYLPDFRLKTPEQTQSLTIRNVLSHTTGLPYHTYTTLIEEGTDLKTMISRLAEVNGGPVGKVYSYQNVAYSLIGEVIQSATGKSYTDLLEERVFGPLHMRNASASFDAIIHNQNIAHPYLFRRKAWREIPISDTYYNTVPAGGVNASIADMASWMKALLGLRPDIIGRESLNDIFTPVITASVKNRSYRQIDHIEGTYYGLGWRILHYPNDTLFYHGGYVNGYRSEVAIYPKDRIGICILSNAPGDVTDTGIPAFFTLYMSKRDSIQTWDEKHRRQIAMYP